MPDYYRAEDLDFVDSPSGTVPQQPQEPPPNPNYELGIRTSIPSALPISNRNIEPSGQGPDITRALLTNEPTRGMAESLVRSGPSTALGIAGASAGPLGAGAGGMAGESLRQLGVNAYAGYTGREYTKPKEVLKQTAIEGVLQASGEAGVRAIGVVGKYGMSRVPTAYRQLFGIPEQTTEYVLGRGARNVLTPENATDDAAQSALEMMQGHLVGQKKGAGNVLSKVEDAIASSGESERLFDTSLVAKKLRSLMEKRGLSGETSGLAVSGDVAELNTIASKLESGLISGADLIKIKRLLDDKIKYVPGQLKPMSSTAEKMIRDVASDLRGTINNAYPEIKAANSEFKKAADLYNKYRKPLGGQSGIEDDIFADEKAMRRLRLEFERGGGSRKALAEFDQHIAKGQNLMQNFFDTVAAKEFAGASPRQLSPSSPILRGLATLGISAPALGGAALKAGEAAYQTASPLIGPGSAILRSGPSTLRNYYLGLQNR